MCPSLLVVSHYSSIKKPQFLRTHPLQVAKDGLGTGELNARLSLLGGVDDLAVVDNDGVSVSPLGTGPADARGELDAGVAHEQLPAELA